MEKKKRTRSKKWRSLSDMPPEVRSRFASDSENQNRPEIIRPEKPIARTAVVSTAYRVEKWSHHGTPNPAMLRHRLVGEGFNVYQWCDHAGSVYAMHKHDTDQSHWIISGTLEISTGGRTYTLGPGDRDLMPAGTYHSARVVDDESVVYLIGEKLG